MSTEARAREIVDTWDSDIHAEYPELVKLIATTLDAREREVWEEAAIMVEQDCFGDVSVEFEGITKEQYTHNLNQIELARKIRQRGAI